MTQAQNNGKPIFSSVLRREMERRGATQEQVAEAADVSQATVNGWLTGAIPRADALHRLAQKFGVSMEYLLYGVASATVGVSMENAPRSVSPEAHRLMAALLTTAHELDRELKKIST